MYPTQSATSSFTQPPSLSPSPTKKSGSAASSYFSIAGEQKKSEEGSKSIADAALLSKKNVNIAGFLGFFNFLLSLILSQYHIIHHFSLKSLVKKGKKTKKADQESSGIKVVTDNRKARFNYHVLEKFEAGIREQYETQGHPYYASARLWDDGVIDPVETREVLSLALSAAMNRPTDAETPFGVFRM